MVLKRIAYCRFEGEAYEWKLEGAHEETQEGVAFKQINLIVGKNATGKSKTLNIFNELGSLLAGEADLSDLVYDTAKYTIDFEDLERKYRYSVSFRGGEIQEETLSLNGEDKLRRNAEKGEMYYKEVKKFLHFQIEADKLATARVDSLQQPFFNALHQWGKNLNYYQFGGLLGKNSLLKDINLITKDTDINPKRTDQVTAIFLSGQKKIGKNEFNNAIISDMEKIGYQLENISVETLKFYPVPGYSLHVKEKDVEGQTDQSEMSQGMFRALSLLIQLNFSLLTRTPSCVLIDDIGEGLDYERSISLIKLIIEKVEDTAIQVFMTTNNRFVMNEIPLEFWSVIHRKPQKSVFYNYANSKKTFEEFKYTGLSNFDFLSSEFYKEGFEEEEGSEV